MRIYICVNGILSNLHLVAIPMFERHTTENIFNLIVRFLDALNGATMIWRAKLMSVPTDGENRMIGCHRGVVTHLEQATEFPVLRIWCVPHQIDIVIKNAAALLQDGQWIEHIIEHIKDQGSFSQECYTGLDENNQKDVMVQISQFAVFIVAGCDCVKAERDGINNASELDAPPVVPHELVKVALRHFISDVLNIYRPHLDHFWSEEDIDEIEVEQRDLIKRYNNDQHIEQIINSYKHTVSFNEA
ncbi:unnamed protein product [Sphagnum jensenii]|uniref:Transposase n=1 Tax=Sphagnum jensenii TaxID=128206 RepID=A0ABP1AMH5_9BRYO